MFKQRLLTALALVPLVLFAIYYANLWIFTGLVLVLLLGCALEWLPLIPVTRYWLKLSFILAILVGTWLLQFNYLSWLIVGMFFWLAIFFAVLGFPKSQRYWGYPELVFTAGVLVLSLFAQSLLWLHAQAQGKNLIVYLLFLVWAADIGAYLAGKQWGKHKLIPLVSPGKTIEGALGGLILSILIAIGGYFYFQPAFPLRWFLIAIIAILVSMLGDLFISMLKRRSKLKDTGHLLPGHGGVLDRLDSLVAALPLFNCGLAFLAPGL